METKVLSVDVRYQDVKTGLLEKERIQVPHKEGEALPLEVVILSIRGLVEKRASVEKKPKTKKSVEEEKPPVTLE